MYKTIDTPKGKYRYKFVPIFEGIKPIDKEIANENLKLLKEVCDRNGLQFLLFFGTLLGAVREHGFITHDEDIDLVMMKSDMPAFLAMLFELREVGFELARYERRGFLSIIRKGEYIDMYFFAPYKKDASLMHCCMDICEKKYLEEVAPMEFLGNTYLAPIESEEYLTHQYGNNWRIPSAKFEFNLSKSARLKQLIIMYIKEFIPTPLLEKLQEKKEQPVIDGFLKSIYEKRQGLLK
ncbi:LicD family protein [uncultured Prevotella sp.]|jgi:glycerol-3-phosphate cytidylyltransferase|uniref:LicD family protein n=1 Tax=uncultured Prevotella sp. TaxID=159272 RepID=UPI00258F79AE|nr:LicD family protein [uncultured Prevotella sp.]